MDSTVRRERDRLLREMDDLRIVVKAMRSAEFSGGERHRIVVANKSNLWDLAVERSEYRAGRFRWVTVEILRGIPWSCVVDKIKERNDG